MPRGFRFAVFILIAMLTAPVVARAAQRDAVATLLADLERALAGGRLTEFIKTSAPDLPAEQIRGLEAIEQIDRDSGRTIAVRERARDDGVVLAEVFIASGRRGRVANWVIDVVPDPARIVSLKEISSFDNLVRLDLDASRQFALKNFTFTAPDFTLAMSTGTAFVAEAPDGITCLVLRGAGRVSFAPRDLIEQGQLRIFAGRPAFESAVNDVFIRVDPADFDRRIASGSLHPVPVDPRALDRARQIFTARAGESYQIALGDLTPDRWSVLPPAGGTLVDIRTNRFGWLTYAVAPEEPEDISFLDRSRNRQISTYESSDHLQRFGRDYIDDVNADFDVKNTSLDVVFDPARTWLSGRAELRVALRKPVSLMKLRLADALRVSSVSSPNFGPLLFLRAAGQNTLVIGLPGEPKSGSEFSVAIQYQGVLPPQGLDREALAVDAAVRDEQGDLSFDVPIEARYLYSARSAWYPQTGTYAHATGSIRITVPSEYQAVATGRMEAEVTSSAAAGQFGPRVRQVRTSEHRADKPIRYLALLVTKLVPVGSTTVAIDVHHETGGRPETAPATDVGITVFSAPVLSGRRRITPETVSRVVSFFGRTLGGAPYRSLTVAVLEDTLPGGHSPAGFVLINQPHPATPLSWSLDPVAFADAPDYFLAHEIAHQWWGQGVGTKNYHEQWISEGFAQYMAWLYLESTGDAGTARRLMIRMRETAMAYDNDGPIHLGGRVGHLRSSSRAFRAVVYNRSAVVLHMLRQLIGDAAFFDGLRRVYSEAVFTRIGTADVERAFQAGTSLPLGNFFARWILESGAPALKMRWSGQGNLFAIRLEQVGNVWTYPVVAQIEYTDGSREDVTLPVTQGVEEFRRPARAAVKDVTIDDDRTIVRVVR